MLEAIVGLVALAIGFFWRELYEIAKRIEKATIVLLAREERKIKEEQKMSFADEVNFEDLSDQEKIDLLNP